MDSKVPKVQPLAHITMNTPNTTPIIHIIEYMLIIIFLVDINNIINARDKLIIIP